MITEPYLVLWILIMPTALFLFDWWRGRSGTTVMSTGGGSNIRGLRPRSLASTTYTKA